MARLGRTELEVFPLNLGGNVFGWTAGEEESFAVLDAYAARRAATSSTRRTPISSSTDGRSRSSGAGSPRAAAATRS